MQYSICKDFYPTVEKKINRIAKKAAKYGNPFTFKVVDEVVKEMTNESGYTGYYPFVIIELDGEAKIGDYECVAVLEMHDTGNIIRRINTQIELPERFQNSENICEHCNTKRNRKNLYVVHNSQTGEFKQVGSDCLLLYTCGLHPNCVASFYDCIIELEKYDDMLSGGYTTPLYPVEEVIGFACEIINKMGYFNTNSDVPTSRLVTALFTPYHSFSENVDKVNDILKNNKLYQAVFWDGDFHKEETEDTVKAIIQYYSELESTKASEFVHNVQILLHDKYVNESHFGYLCYLPEGYNRHLKEEEQKAKQRKVDEKSEFFGDVGDRYKSQNICDIRILTGWDTIYGTTYLYKIVLETGNILIWKSSSWHSKEELDKVHRIDFTVKGHDEYKGVKQTTVTRCKFVA